MVNQFPTEQHCVATELQAQPLSILPLCVTNVTLIRLVLNQPVDITALLAIQQNAVTSASSSRCLH